MSYDISVGPESFNYTYNLAKLFHDHISLDEKTGLQSLNGKSGAEAALALKGAFERLDQTHYDRREGFVSGLAQYNSSNGWGDGVGATLMLGRLLGACAAFPDAVVEVS